MICHRHRCIYILQPKAASTSILNSFGVQIDPRKQPEQHKLDYGVKSKSDWYGRPRGYFVFSSVRNPFDKVVSGWSFLQRHKRSKLHGVPLEICLEKTVKELGSFDYCHLRMPQVERLKLGRRLVSDDIIRFESLQADFDRVCERIGKPRTKLKHLNKMSHASYREFISPRLREQIERIFAADFEAFGYSW